jgi:hypothetical protein
MLHPGLWLFLAAIAMLACALLAALYFLIRDESIPDNKPSKVSNLK